MLLEFDQDTKLNSILEKIQSSPDLELEVSLPENSILYQNSINQEIIRRFATDLGKKISFVTSAGISQNLETPISEDLDFVEGQDIAHLAGDSPGEAAVPIAAAPVGLEEKPKRKLKIPRVPSFIAVPKLWVFGLGGILLLSFLVFGFIWLLPSANVTLSYKPQTKTATNTLTAIVDGKFDAEKANIPAGTEELLKTETSSANATGKKSVGTAAKGRVTIYNHSTTDSRTFFAGTTITSISGGVKFKLDSDVTVDTASGPGSPKTVGVNVTASNNGPTGNLAANTTFQVGSETDTGVLYAKNDVAFSGGTTKTLTIVSEADRKALKAKMLKSLSEKATTEIKEKNKDVIIPEGGVEATVSKETYDKELGQEATTFSLTLEVQTRAVLLTKENIQKALSQNMEVAAGLKVDENNSKVTIKSAKKLSESSYKLEASIDALLIPNVDLGKLTKDLGGKDTNSAKNLLEDLPGIESYSIVVNPAPYRILGRMPFSSDKISITLEEQK